MTIFLWVIIGIIALAAVLEITARIYHRFHFLVPFHSKVIGEYPYNSFIEKQDPPLFYRFKKDFRSPSININRFRCRGPEPAPDGQKKRVLVIGESYYFGVKLRREKDLWSVKLEDLLAQNRHSDWEVLNAGNPTYNSLQHRLIWEQELHRVKPDILVLDLGGNDVSQAWMMGAKWAPGAPWPWKFIMALERKSPWWNKYLARFCFYFLMRRSMTERKSFPRMDEDFQWKACVETIRDNYRAIAADARNIGAKVACTLYALAYDMKPSLEDGRRLEAIQANWKSFIEGRGVYDYGLIDLLSGKWRSELDMPYIDMTGAFHSHPRRYELYLDMGHFNAEGMDLVASTFYEEIDKLGWWDT